MQGEQWPPADAEFVTGFHVAGKPRPAGSKDPFIVTKLDADGRRVPVTDAKTGRIITRVKDSSGEAGGNWRSDIRAAASLVLEEAYELLDGPLAVRVTFSYPGPASRFGTGKNAGVLKASAPRYPHRGDLADGTKLARALEDALTSIVWTDDRRVCDMWWSRRFGPAGATVEVFALPERAPIPAPAEAITLLSSSEMNGGT